MGNRLRKVLIALVTTAVAGIWVVAPDAGAIPPPDTVVEVTADFESLVPNQMVSTIATGEGMITTSGVHVPGVVSVTGNTTRPPRDDNWAAIFDATCSGGGTAPCGGDPDLEQPQQGNVLITDRYGDRNGDGFVDGRNGANDAAGHVLTLGFDQLGGGTITPKSITVLDIDHSETAAEIVFLSAGSVIDTVLTPETGDGGIVTIDLSGRGDGADTMRLSFPRSGALDDFMFEARIPCRAPNVRAAAAAANAMHVEIPGLDTTVDLPDPLGTRVGTDGLDAQANELLDQTIADLIDIELLRQEVEVDATPFASGNGFTHVAGIDIADGLITVDGVLSRSYGQASPFGAFGSTVGSQVDDIAVNGVPLLDLDVGEVVTLGSVVPILDIGQVTLYDRDVSGSIIDGMWVGRADMTALRIEIFADAFPADSPLEVLNGLLLEVGSTTGIGRAAANPCSNQVAPHTDANAKIVGVEAGLVPVLSTAPVITPDLLAVNLLTAGPIAPAGYDFAQGLGLTVDGVAGAGVGVVEAEGVTDDVAAVANARAELLGLDLLDGAVTAELLQSYVRVHADESDTVLEADSRFLNVTVPFVAAPVSVCALPVATANPDGTCSVPPNTEFTISVLGTNLVTVVLNQQVDTESGVQLPPGLGCADFGVTDCTVRAIALRTGLDAVGLATQIHLVESRATASMPPAP